MEVAQIVRPSMVEGNALTQDRPSGSIGIGKDIAVSNFSIAVRSIFPPLNTEAKNPMVLVKPTGIDGVI
jgi:hypothetical protein